MATFPVSLQPPPSCSPFPFSFASNRVGGKVSPGMKRHNSRRRCGALHVSLVRLFAYFSPENVVDLWLLASHVWEFSSLFSKIWSKIFFIS